MSDLPYTVCFGRKEAPPREAALQRAPGAAYGPYLEILKATKDLQHEWKFYG